MGMVSSSGMKKKTKWFCQYWLTTNSHRFTMKMIESYTAMKYAQLSASAYNEIPHRSKHLQERKWPFPWYVKSCGTKLFCLSPPSKPPHKTSRLQPTCWTPWQHIRTAALVWRRIWSVNESELLSLTVKASIWLCSIRRSSGGPALTRPRRDASPYPACEKRHVGAPSRFAFKMKPFRNVLRHFRGGRHKLFSTKSTIATASSFSMILLSDHCGSASKGLFFRPGAAISENPCDSYTPNF